MKRNINLIKLLLVTGFWLLIAANIAGQGCVTNITISFFQNTGSLPYTPTLSIPVCGDIGPSQNDIDIWSTTTSGGNPSGMVRHWEWSNDPSFATFTTDPYTGTQY